MPAACAIKGSSLQFPSVSTEAKLTSCQHGGLCKVKHVPPEPRFVQSKKIWRAKTRASLHEALGEVEAQPRLSREEKGKALLSVNGVAYAASIRTLKVPLAARLNWTHNVELDAKARWLHLIR